MPTPASPLRLEQLRELLANRAWRLNNLYRIQNKWGNEVPFRMNAVQARLDASFHTLNIALKARQFGITTYCCMRWLDTALFRENTQCGVIADTLDNAQGFFREKILYAYDRLPRWLKEIRPLTRRDMTGEMEIANGSRIKVGVSLRGGTLQCLHISEYGKICARDPLRAREIQSGALNTVAPGNIVMIESTAEGVVGDFYKKCQTALALQKQVAAGKAKLTAMDYKVHFMPWYEDGAYAIDDPAIELPDDVDEYLATVEEHGGITLSRPQKAWYFKKAQEQGDLMWREYPSTPDEAFKASKDGSYYARHLDMADAQGRICRLPHKPGAPVFTFWDLGRNDTTAILFMQQDGPWLNFIDAYENSGESMDHYANHLQRLARERGYVYGSCHLPHDAQVTEFTRSDNKTREQVLQGFGFDTVIVPRIEYLPDGIEMVRQMLPICRFDSLRCGESPPGSGLGALPALRSYRKEWNEKTQAWRDQPLHDWSSNYADALRQCAQGFTPIVERRKRDREATPRRSWKTA